MLLRCALKEAQSTYVVAFDLLLYTGYVVCPQVAVRSDHEELAQSLILPHLPVDGIYPALLLGRRLR